MTFAFNIEKSSNTTLARAGVIHTPHGDIKTPAFIAVGTKATVKSLTTDEVSALGAQAVLANTYHLYLQPGNELVRKAGGLGKFMNWSKPTFTDSGGFQVFSLGEAYGKGISKVATSEAIVADEIEPVSDHSKLASVDDEGVTFSSHIDGSIHRFTPEHSMQVQHDLGADIIFAFDECTSPSASEEYQKKALNRTHRWAERSLTKHKELGGSQALYGVVQGGRSRELRELSAKAIGAMDFDGFGIGGSFTKDDIGTAVAWVNTILPKEKPRHLLGIGEPIDLFLGVENGVDTFDCVAPTRIARNGAVYTLDGRMNLRNAQYIADLAPIDPECTCTTCQHYSRAYLAHLFRAEEMLAATLASVHNLHFIISLVARIREAIFTETLEDLKKQFIPRYYKS